MHNFAVFKSLLNISSNSLIPFFFFLTIQFTKLQVILSLEEEIACTIRSTINKHDKPRNSLLLRDRKSWVKKSNMTHIPPYLMFPPSICGNRQNKANRKCNSVMSLPLIQISRRFFFFIIQIYFKIWQFIKAYYPIIKKF